MKDPRQDRALALTLFHALRHELSTIDDELSPETARSLLLRAINFLPGIQVVEGPRKNLLLLQPENGPAVALNVQDALDSLRLVWREYMRMEERAAREQAR
ncbi:MAG: hypothetical protein K1X75_16130 [Leptospirales bacterium]|nr:hypothetical protein [Leptospirales bacterium]